MKRNFVASLCGSFIGFGMVFILLSAAGIVGARSSEVARTKVTHVNAVAATPLTSTFTYQGQIKNSGTVVNGACQMAFRLYDAPAGSGLIGSPITTTVPVTNGLFTVGLNFGSTAFNGNGRWLDINVDCGSGVIPLTPRQAVTAAPYSFYAVSAGSLQSYPVTTTTPLNGQVLKWNGSAWVPSADAGGTTYSAGFGLSLIGSQFNVVTSFIQQRVSSACSTGNAIRVINQDGSVTCQTINSNFWGLTGNAGTVDGVNFLGTTDNVSLTIRVNNSPALRIIPNATSPNIIGGYSGNFISPTVVGGVIGGGGENSVENRVQANYATVGGGFANQATGDFATVGGGFANQANGYATTVGGGGNEANGDNATVGGGNSNQANGSIATVGGGLQNQANGNFATVGGGGGNQANGNYATVGGGKNDQATGYASTIPGGEYNTATMTDTLAAGNNAHAINQGAFVWADSTGASFSSTGNNQFLIRASGGVGINTNSPATALSVVYPGGSTPIHIGTANCLSQNSGITFSSTIGPCNNYSLLGDGINTIINRASGGSLAFREGNADQMLIGSGGLVSIYNLGSGGTALCINGNQISNCSSSLRYKTNLADLTLGLETIAKLRPITFNWKVDGQPDLGLVAEEVNQVTPLLTTYYKGQIEGVKYDRLTAILVKGIQEQQVQIASLQSQNAQQQTRLDSLDARLMALEQANPSVASSASSLALNLPALTVVLAIGLVIGRRKHH